MYTIRFKKSAEKELSKLSNRVIKKIADTIDSLSENPRPFGSKKLIGQNEVL
jgi:mRNA-degrading endonuclease RelE of RelBE toxin-antitoxin system